MPKMDVGSLWVSEGVNHLSSYRSLIGMLIRWRAMKKDLVKAEGYVRHRIIFEKPLTVGLMVWWREESNPWQYAKGSVHKELVRWGESGCTNGGWMIIYKAERVGPVGDQGEESVYKALGRD